MILEDPIQTIEALERALQKMVGPLLYFFMNTARGPLFFTFFAIVVGAFVRLLFVDAASGILRSMILAATWVVPLAILYFSAGRAEQRLGGGKAVARFSHLWTKIRALHRSVDAGKSAPARTEQTLDEALTEYESLAFLLQIPTEPIP
jgi:hypothetical protein